MEIKQAYPLQWPVGWKRTPANERKLGRFRKSKQYNDWITVDVATSRVCDELRRMGVDRNDFVISTNLQLRMDGFPRSGQPTRISDPGVAVYWMDGKEQRCMAIDIYTEANDNIAAVAATLDAMRAIERHGGAEILNRAFSGFTALPAAGETSGVPLWRDVLGFKQGTTVTKQDVELNFRALSKKAHPDTGGSDGEMAMLLRAREMANQELG